MICEQLDFQQRDWDCIASVHEAHRVGTVPVALRSRAQSTVNTQFSEHGL